MTADFLLMSTELAKLLTLTLTLTLLAQRRSWRVIQCKVDNENVNETENGQLA